MLNIRVAVIFLGFLIGFILVIIFFRYNSPKTGAATNNQTHPQSSISTENPNQFKVAAPPTESLKGKIATFSGVLKWQPRTATDSSQIYSPQPIQQGEEIETGDNGKAVIQFPDIFTVSAGKNTKINFAQTLPINIVLVQSTGEVNYVTLGKNNLSVRSLHLLIEQQAIGNFTITVDPDDSKVLIVNKTGVLTIAYNDSDNLSQKLTLNKDQTLSFDDDKRKVVIR
jgi:hypothetical protein